MSNRFRVQVTANDEQTKISTSLILYDSQVTKIIGKSALSLYDLFADNRDTIPHELYEMVGKQWLFRLPKNNLNGCTYDANIVSCISDDHVLINVFNEILASQSISLFTLITCNLFVS